MTRAEQIAAVLAEHHRKAPASIWCTCGWRTPETAAVRPYAVQHVRHLARALDAALVADENAQNSSPAGSPAPTMDPSERANGGTAVASRTGTGPAGEVARIIEALAVEAESWPDDEADSGGAVADWLRSRVPPLAAQEGERGGADECPACGANVRFCCLYAYDHRERGGVEVAAAVEAALPVGPRPFADAYFIGAHDLAARVRAAIADSAGALAKVKAEAWDECVRAVAGVSPDAIHNPYREGAGS